MSNERPLGQLKSTVSQVDVEWEIADFLSLSACVNKSYYSPTFFFCNYTWCLRVYPNGQRHHSSEGNVGVYVRRKDSGPPISVTYSLFLGKTGGTRETVNKDMKTFGAVSRAWGAPNAIKKSKLIEQNSKFLPSGVLTIMCTLKCEEKQEIKPTEDCITSAEVSSTQSEVRIGTMKLLSDLKGLANRGDESDITVIVQGKEFHLHKAIMGARTPVFNAMFKHNMKEKATGVVSVDDCEAEIFSVFVHYLYTGKEDELSPENAVRVYELADKYQVGELKVSCLDIMKRALSVNVFCDILSFALRYEVQDVMERCIDFLADNMIGVMGSKGWENLIRSNTKQVNKILMQVVSKNRKT